jgi:hypothetical protein
VKWYWMGARDHVDHTMCGGCDDDADCTWNERRASIPMFIVSGVLIAISLALWLTSCTFYSDPIEPAGSGITYFDDPACWEDSGVHWGDARSRELACGVRR